MIYASTGIWIWVQSGSGIFDRATIELTNILFGYPEVVELAATNSAWEEASAVGDL